MTTKKADKLLKKWKKKLGLQNWDIFLKINQKKEDMDGCNGLIEWNPVQRCAVIKIKDKKEIYSDSLASFNFKKTLVHELLHLKFELFESKDKNSAVYENFHQQLEDMARLITGYKNKFKPN